MNKIDKYHRNVYGKDFNWDDLKKWYISDISTEIYDRLRIDVEPKSKKEIEFKDRLINNLPQILLMPPARMEKYVATIDKLYLDILVQKTSKGIERKEFGKQIYNAFHYEGYRRNKLVELTTWLNVKTCPYCNMSYTLYSEIVKPGRKKVPQSDKIAKLQFDHFYSKQKYPMLSMCLYNLIPVCPICNQGKSTQNLPLRFNPYYTDIHSQFVFRIDRTVPGLVGATFSDYTPVVLKWDPSVDKRESKVFEKAFPLKALYSRHGDIVQEIYDKAYAAPLYLNSKNFPFLDPEAHDYLKRLWFGGYMKKEEIHMRPLTKFRQDVLTQALGERESLKLLSYIFGLSNI